MGSKAYLKNTKFAIPRNPTKCSQHCEDAPSKGRLDRSLRSEQQIFEEPKKDETQSPIDAVKEMESLLYKDYKGRPAHKPPINNHEPNN